MDNQVSIRFRKTEKKNKDIDVSKWFKFIQAHNKYLNKSDKQIEHFLRNYTFCIQYGKKIATQNLEGLYSILIEKIKHSSYNDSRLEIIFKLTDEEKNYWLTGFPFKFHEDIIEQPSKEQSIYKPTFYEENFKSRHTQFEIGNKTGIKNIPDFIDSTKKSVFGLIKKWLLKHKSVKAHLCVICTYEKGGIIDVVESAVKYLQTPNYDIFPESNLDEIYKEMKAKILYEHERVSDSLRGSQWVLISINTLNVAINKYAPIKGSSYIPTPVKIANRKAVINVKNEDDDKCFFMVNFGSFISS
ncbi:unnamed protein product [Macrosiphum euphorbiae]|uniref:Uncharacterized protein n=1 Tax=Macrosiphum euphorbiae TaxID=13131 RepID=A0AAV0W7T4_9HEMI|nr:unnamed protein product [Macrosiphum euphorbiae]